MICEAGLWQRPEDRLIIDEAATVYADLPIASGDVFLDLGAHIGAASRMALAKGAASVVAVEADVGSLAVLRRNLEDYPAEIIWAAVGPHAVFYADPTRPYLSSTLADVGRQVAVVPTVDLAMLLDRYQPTVVKCDIEFGEYDLPALRRLPSVVRVLAMEVHVRHDFVFRYRRQTPDQLRDQRLAAARLMADVEAQGFTAIRRDVKQRRGLAAMPDASGLPPLAVSVDGIWVR